MQFLAIHHSLSTGVQQDYTALEGALREKYVLKEHIELHNAKFCTRSHEGEEKL